jgi:DNA-binding response OmpR family regulator
MILEHVWDMSVDIFSNTIESHILSLRKKLKDTGKDRIIQTIPGRGYRMGA